MTIGRHLIYVTFLALLLGTLVVSHAERAVAEDYADLPASAELINPLEAGDRAPGACSRWGPRPP